MTQTAYVPFGGGIDLTTPVRQVEPGRCLFAVNYEAPITGGYRRIEGYEQLGQELPGEGPVLGVVVFADNFYAVRADVGQNEATLYSYDTGTKSWSAVSGTEGALASGRYEFTEGNLSATSTGRALYGVGGGKPFELKSDGSFRVLDQAPSGAKFIALHQNHLMLGFEIGSLQFSGIGDPNEWDAATGGAGEIGLQQELRGLLEGRGGALHIGCRDSMKALFGSSSENFELRITVPNSGAKSYSMQSYIEPYFVAERGITGLQASNDFGDFSPVLPGNSIQPIFSDDGFSDRVIASCVSKRLAQYRVLFDNKTGIYWSPAGATTVEFPVQMVVLNNGEMDVGTEIILSGDADGNVYQFDADASSFNGQNITAFITIAYNDLNSPSAKKRYRRAFFDIDSGTEDTISVRPELDFGDIESARQLRFFLEYERTGGLWNVDNWDEFAWSSPVLATEPVDVSGSGESVGFSIFSSGTARPHIIYGYTLHYEIRRRNRG